MLRPLVFALVLALCATGAKADRHEDCVQSADLERKIRCCTQIIERGTRESLENRASAYFHRGVAYYEKGEVDGAIALDPKNAEAYSNRGVAYVAKGDKEQAIADFRKALEIDPSNQLAKIGFDVLGVTP